MIADRILTNIKEILTPYHTPPIKGEKMNDLSRITNGFIAIKDGVIIGVGSSNYEEFVGENTIIDDCSNMIATPGFVDSHTHLVHGGSREQEFKKKLQGMDYMDILAQGGGILSTVAMTRKASKEELYDQAVVSLKRMLQHGVTTVEGKSGYGLNHDDELKQLEVMHALKQIFPIHLVITYLGAHALPSEYKNKKDKYVDFIIEELTHISRLGYVEFVDVFCEKGVFSIEETKRILIEAKRLGFKTRFHADEIVGLGGAGLAVELDSSSADHLMAIKDEDIAPLSQSNTIATVLPGTSFYLNKPYANVRKLINMNVAVAIASDYNPGSSPSENFELIMQLAANKYQMTPEEVLTAATLNPAYSLNKDANVGSIEVGKQADVVIFDAPNFAYVLYHYGINHVKRVYIKGNIEYEKENSNETY